MPATVESSNPTAADIAQNVKAEGLSNDPEAQVYNPNTPWNPGAWAGSGAPTPTPKRPVEPIGNPPRRIEPVGGPMKPIKIGFGSNPPRATPHYGQSFAANSPTTPAPSGTLGGTETESEFDPIKFMSGA